MSDFMKTPCGKCPYRDDVKPFLRAERGEELAYLSQNPYSEFTCHKTLDHDDDNGETVIGARSKTCAGFLTLMHNENGETPYDSEGFKPSPEIVYGGVYEMVDAYEEGDL